MASQQNQCVEQLNSNGTNDVLKVSVVFHTKDQIRRFWIAFLSSTLKQLKRVITCHVLRVNIYVFSTVAEGLSFCILPFARLALRRFVNDYELGEVRVAVLLYYSAVRSFTSVFFFF